MEATTVEIVSAAAQIVIGLGTVALSLVIYFRSRRNERALYMAESLRNWIELNNTILSSNDRELLQASTDLLGAQGDTPTDQLRIHLTYNLLNILESEYVGFKDGLMRKEYHEKTSENILSLLVNKPGVIGLIESSGYHRSFVKYCQSLLKPMPVNKQVPLKDANLSTPDKSRK